MIRLAVGACEGSANATRSLDSFLKSALNFGTIPEYDGRLQSLCSTDRGRPLLPMTRASQSGAREETMHDIERRAFMKSAAIGETLISGR
jgi:hypothetical protein